MTQIKIIILIKDKGRRAVRKVVTKDGFSTVKPSLLKKIDECTSRAELFKLFFSIDRKNRATMDAFIRKREALDLLYGKPIFPPQNTSKNGSTALTK